MSGSQLSTRYNAKETESGWYGQWESQGYFRPASDFTPKKSGRKPYVIVIPPPNVTGILHMGHALNNSIQDILTRWHRMKGDDTLWVPGVDHAGIATQNVVERKLAKEKKTRHDLGREKFLEQVWKWKNEHGSTITRQLRGLGASCDWSRERFTMDEGLSRAVREAFVTLYERGLIYQGNYIINWCPRCQTALSDEESVHKEVQGGLYHIKYPLAGLKNQKVPGPVGTWYLSAVGEDHIVVATTRPETMLGDTAVAVNPNDPRYQHLVGKKLILPLMEREIPIIADAHVDPQFGTGLVKVTPAHDPHDFEMGMRHNLPQINVMNPNGSMNENGGRYQGLDRFAARKKVIEDLETQGLFVRRDTHSHAVGHCYRCDTVVEPYLSKQWFVKMKPLAQKALKAHRAGKTVFYPDRWTKVYTHWLEGIRDWCISRQIWWGHQIPVWYCEGDKQCLLSCKEPIVRRETPEKCPACGSKNLRQDPDVLDTWFSSWLWPFSTLGWPDKTEDLKHFYPTSELITAPEIIFFWVARMIMAGLILDPLGVEKQDKEAEPPFSRIYIHGTVRAQSGLKMSKSLGNAIDPLEVIEEIGADALRFSMIMLSAQDVYLSREKFEVGRNFTNKIWNAARFVLMNLENKNTYRITDKVEAASLSGNNFWIILRFEKTLTALERHLSNFDLSQAATILYHFVWNDFCDWFIELAKVSLASDSESKEETQKVLFFVLEKILRLLHPFMPFITEEIWQKLREMAINKDEWPKTLMLVAWPSPPEDRNIPNIEYEYDLFQKAVSSLRDLRTQLGIPPGKTLKAVLCAKEGKVQKILSGYEKEIKTLGRLEELHFDKPFRKDTAHVAGVFADFDIFVSVAGIIDPQKERERIAKKIAESRTWIESLRRKLADGNFIKRAPAGLVEKEKEKLADAENILKAHEDHLALFQ